MRNSLKITTRFAGGYFEVLAEVAEGEVKDIFIYGTKDDGQLGEYIGIAFVPELSKIKVWDPASRSAFGMRRVRYHQGRAFLETEKEQTQMVEHMKQTFARLCSQLGDLDKEVVEYYVVEN